MGLRNLPILLDRTTVRYSVIDCVRGPRSDPFVNSRIDGYLPERRPRMTERSDLQHEGYFSNLGPTTILPSWVVDPEKKTEVCNTDTTLQTGGT